MSNDEERVMALTATLITLVKTTSPAEGMTALTMAVATLCADSDEMTGRHNTGEVFMREVYGSIATIKGFRKRRAEAEKQP